MCYIVNQPVLNSLVGRCRIVSRLQLCKRVVRIPVSEKFSAKQHRIIMANVSFNYKGLIVPVLTPINNDSKRTIDLSIIPAYANYLLKKGIKGVLVNGTTGEGPSLSLNERKSITETWVNVVKTTKQHLMVQIGGCSLSDVIELAKQAEILKVDSLLCLPELYFKPENPQQVIDYLKIVGEAAPNTPLLYYHIPSITNVNIDIPQLLQSVGNQVPTFVGVKFTNTNLAEGARAVSVQNNKYAILLGNDELISAGCLVGIDSFIATSINIFPELILEILENYKKGNIQKCKEKQEQLSKVVIAISKYGNWVETMKVATCLLTEINVGPVRAPLKQLSTNVVNQLAKDLNALGYRVSL